MPVSHRDKNRATRTVQNRTSRRESEHVSRILATGQGGQVIEIKIKVNSDGMA